MTVQEKTRDVDTNMTMPSAILGMDYLAVQRMVTVVKQDQIVTAKAVLTTGKRDKLTRL